MLDTWTLYLNSSFNRTFKSTATFVSPHYHLPARFCPVGHQAALSAKLSEKTARPLLSGYPDPESGTKGKTKPRKKGQGKNLLKKGTTGDPSQRPIFFFNFLESMSPVISVINLVCCIDFLLSETKVWSFTHHAGPLGSSSRSESLFQQANSPRRCAISCRDLQASVKIWHFRPPIGTVCGALTWLSLNDQHTWWMTNFIQLDAFS